ncbi:MAG: alcohol dehydrogenase catalytic domain-containing protein [Thermodesulfovibrionales bacterium]
MKVAKLYSADDIRIEDAPIPPLGDGEALMETRACGICSGDVMKWYIERKAPLVLGHEPSGVIVQTGAGVTGVRPGDRVFVHHHAPCMCCSHCRRGDHVHCSSWRASRIIPGGISEYVIIPELNLCHDTLTLPADISFDAATLIEPAGCVVKSLRGSSLRNGDTVLVLGLGVMGQLHIMVARSMGAGTVIGADMVPFRLQKAQESGADHIIDVGTTSLRAAVGKLTAGQMAQVVVVGPNSARAMIEGLSCVAAGGTLLLFTPALPGEMISLDPNDLYFRDVSIVTSYSCGPNDTREALRLISQGTIRPETIITHRFDISGTAEAYRLTAEARNSIKCIVVFEKGG